MGDSIINIIDGDKLSKQKKVVDDAIDKVEEIHLDYFKSQPAYLDGDEYLRLRSIIVITYPNTSITGTEKVLDCSMSLIKEIPNDIWENLKSNISDALTLAKKG